MIGKVFNYIRYRNLKNYIHTALQVKSKTNLGLQAVLVRINTQVLYRILIILLSNRVFDLCSLAVIVTCGKRE